MRTIVISAMLGLTLVTEMYFAIVVAEPSGADETAFLSEMNASMMRMHSAMEVAPTGNIDADFIAMMLPHHQGAIDMARIQLHYGHNEQLRRIAQEIIVEQQQEIIAMKQLSNSPTLR